jgi:iron complex outermembrane receptor protein
VFVRDSSSVIQWFLRFLSFAVVLAIAAPAWAAGVLEIKVTDPDGAALPGATVTVPGRSAECVTDASGLCRMEGLPAGLYDVAVRLPNFLGARKEVTVSDGTPARIEFALGLAVHFSESVTVSPAGRDSFESYQPVAVLAGEERDQNLAGSLGDTLSAQLGVNVRAFGSGPARPVVRGLDGDRVLVLENGARTGDLSSQSGDHGVAVDPAQATRIEVVRGPATLLYGSNAIGGVVNLISDEIPNKPVHGATGALTAQGGTNSDEAGLAGNASFGNGSWAFRLNGTARRTSDYETPLGKVDNSQTQTQGGGGAVGYTTDQGYFGVSYQYLKMEYGLPVISDEIVKLNPRRHRVDVRGERRDLSGPIEGIQFEGAFRDYRHEEIDVETGDVGTAFHNKFTEGQLKLNHRAVGHLKGTFGLWANHRDYTSEGEEALAPPTKQNGFAGFLYEELGFRHVSLQFGARYDHTSYDPDLAAVPERENLRARDFNEFSGSVGILGYLRDDLTLAVSFARAARNPSLEELYNFGAHPGNFAFEIGDPNLKTEVGYGLDASLRHRSPRVAAELTFFRNRIDDFIFPFQTGEIEDGLTVIEYIQSNSLLQGVEAHFDLGLRKAVWLELGGDGVRGELRSDGTPLPRIPPYRGWVGLRYQTSKWHLEGQLRAAARQDRLYGQETPTAGYAVANFHGSYTVTSGRTAHIVTLRVDNAGDTTYRNHLSYIKDVIPELGRNVKLIYTVRF